mmetsp:Transcript_21665/g.34386  ORF Transcript_21665/g.34386 Transcript_21665/m.34386 type:complete len:231 (+) Transcript_21665:165-857(+)
MYPTLVVTPFRFRLGLLLFIGLNAAQHSRASPCKSPCQPWHVQGAPCGPLGLRPLGAWDVSQPTGDASAGSLRRRDRGGWQPVCHVLSAFPWARKPVHMYWLHIDGGRVSILIVSNSHIWRPRPHCPAPSSAAHNTTQAIFIFLDVALSPPLRLPPLWSFSLAALAALHPCTGSSALMHKPVNPESTGCSPVSVSAAPQRMSKCAGSKRLLASGCPSKFVSSLQSVERDI